MVGYVQGQSSFLGIILKLLSLLKRSGGSFSSLPAEAGFLPSLVHRLLQSLHFLGKILGVHVKLTSVNVLTPPYDLLPQFIVLLVVR